MRNNWLKFALIAFFITVGWTLIEHFFGYNTTNHQVGQHTRLLTAYVYYSFVVYAIWRERKEQDNTLTFADGMKTGARLAIVYSLLAAIWFAFYAEVMNPQYGPSLIAFEREKLEALKVSPERMAAKMKEVEMVSGGSVTSYLLLALFMFLSAFFPTIIASFLLKRKAKSTT
ncbi:MAG: hypothetical protein JWQ96_3231 [Segetibacter sp.]|nr:hypothetical protein [Segetibacter sp.]